MAKKTLAEQIAELSAPKSDFDIENSELADRFQGSDDDSDNSVDLDDEVARRGHYVAVEKSKLRRENGLIKDKKYTGKVTDRKALYEDNEGSSGQEQDGSSGSGSEEEDSGSEEGMSGDNLSEIPPNAVESDEELDEDSDEDSEGSENDSEDDSNEDSNEDSSGEIAANSQRHKIKQMMASERKHIVSRLSQSAAADAMKGYAILQQHKQFDALIDSRLKVQKALTASNFLPANKMQFEAVVSESPKSISQINSKIDLAATACYDLLDQIGSLRHALFQKEQLVSEESESTAKSPKKRSLEQYLARSLKQDEILQQYRATVLTKWLAKIQNSSGSSAMNASKFKALNQLAEQQVLNNISDMDRLVKRTRLNRRKITPLGYTEEAQEATENGEKGEKDQDNENSEKDEISPGNAQSRSLNLQEMPQIFDDEDFYRVLLNDLVDKKIQLSDPTLGLQFALRGAASTKLKKNVDNKASKGRKLRFHVQEPIANFDTPRQWLKWNDDQIDEFFASLLGQKVSLKEHEEEEEEGGVNSDAEEEEMLAQDSIQLFG